MSAAALQLLEAVRALPLDERMDLARTVLDEAGREMADAPLSDDLKAELNRRLAYADAHPEAGVPWEVVRERARARVAARRAAEGHRP